VNIDKNHKLANHVNLSSLVILSDEMNKCGWIGNRIQSLKKRGKISVFGFEKKRLRQNGF
jgi:hypothetical protein